MQLYPIETGNFKLDGGAMFGVVPKSLWSRKMSADPNNMIGLAMRCLLIEDGNRLILIDTGIGNKQSDKFFGHYYLWGDHSLDGSLKKHGFHRDDITDVFMTHLHFDHCGGSVQWNADRSGYEPAFKNARFWTNEAHWQWAVNPNKREKASFLSENLLPMKESGQLNYIAPANTHFTSSSELGFGIWYVDGHTEKQMLPHIVYKGKTIVFTADLVPTAAHIPLPYIMGYDMRPLVTLNEKERFLKEACENNYLLFFEHDAQHELASLKKTERGIQLDETFRFSDVFGPQI